MEFNCPSRALGQSERDKKYALSSYLVLSSRCTSAMFFFSFFFSYLKNDNVSFSLKVFLVQLKSEGLKNKIEKDTISR